MPIFRFFFIFDFLPFRKGIKKLCQKILGNNHVLLEVISPEDFKKIQDFSDLMKSTSKKRDLSVEHKRSTKKASEPPCKKLVKVESNPSIKVASKPTGKENVKVESNVLAEKASQPPCKELKAESHPELVRSIKLHIKSTWKYIPGGFFGFPDLKENIRKKKGSPDLDFPPLASLNDKTVYDPPRIYKVVSSLGFYKSNETSSIMFKCFQPNCPFIIKDLETFTAHLYDKHFKVPWSGFCTACVAVVAIPPSFIRGEMNHLMWHVRGGFQAQVAH